MNQERVREILEKIQSVKIAVYGDFAIDAYWILDERGGEISLETGKQAQAVEKQYYTLGGASNIVANLAELQPESIHTIGVIGQDIFGRELKRQLSDLQVDVQGFVIQDKNFDTITFAKRYLKDEEEPRIDFGFFNERSQESDTQILNNIEEALQKYDALIFNQQVPGSLNNQEFVEKCNALFQKYDDKIIVFDSRQYGDQFNHMYRKANEVEVAQLNGMDADPEDVIPKNTLREFGLNLYKESRKPLFITRGPRGILVIDGGSIHEISGIQLNKQLDPVGAGDTIISALGLCLAAGISPEESARFANFAAAVTVQKLFQTGTASPDEIIEISNDPSFIYQPDLARDIRKANYYSTSNIELCYSLSDLPKANIKHAVFDHDGTISVLRQGWEDVMEPVMIKAILGEKYESADQKLLDRIRRQVKEYIDQSTGIQTILQMDALVGMVKDFGFVPEEEILDKQGYKRIYNESLMKMVNRRTTKFENGDLNLHDVTIKNSVEFAAKLKERGVKLYLASGTDLGDVVEEAKTLGYAGLFEGGIYGAVGDVSKYSKKMVLNDIIKDNKLAGEELAVFGDGPVELRECRKVGGLAIGIASDEVRRYGLDESKRTRLIKAGAHLIIPDFSQYDNLFTFLSS